MGPRVVPAVMIAALASLVLTGCGRINAPPAPTTTRIPTIVGEAQDWADPNESVRLDSGDVVQIRDPGSETGGPARLTSMAVSLPGSSRGGSLVLAGTDDHGPFYAATMPQAPSGCFELHGQGYIEADRIHMSTGLAVPFAPDIQRTNDRGYYDPSWLLEADIVCVDRAGTVTSIRQLPLGA